MATTTNTLIESKYAENSQTTQYTTEGTGAKTKITSFTATNSTGTAAQISVNLVPNGGSAGASNVITSIKNLAANETYTFPELIGQVLESGAFISTLADTASAIVIRANGLLIVQ